MSNADPVSAADLRLAQMEPANSASLNMAEMQELLLILMALQEQEGSKRNEMSLRLILDQLDKKLNKIHLRFFKIEGKQDEYPDFASISRCANSDEETNAAGFPKGIFE